MKIENKEKFENGLENFNLLRNSAGCIMERLFYLMKFSEYNEYNLIMLNSYKNL